eukprot:scaffold165413_cov30-Tisochrysis_lutea.AAC.1
MSQHSLFFTHKHDSYAADTAIGHMLANCEPQHPSTLHYAKYGHRHKGIAECATLSTHQHSPPPLNGATHRSSLKLYFLIPIFYETPRTRPATLVSSHLVQMRQPAFLLEGLSWPGSPWHD